MNCDLLKTTNVLVNTAIFPGSLEPSTYGVQHAFDEGQELLFIPFQSTSLALSAPRHIVCLLTSAPPDCRESAFFFIHFHGNMTDLGQLAPCARYESDHFNSPYLAVEYPQYGAAKHEGYPAEAVLNEVSRAVHRFVVHDLKVPPDRVVIVGRSIGTGPACDLAAHLETVRQRPAALVLHAPFCSLRDAAYDLLGCFSFLFLNRYENWRKLLPAGNGSTSSSRKGGGNSSSSDADTTTTTMMSTVENPLVAAFGVVAQSDGYAAAAAQQGDDDNDDVAHRGSGGGVARCAVLFIHADSDKIIDTHHSVMMHQRRQAAGLPSTLHIQRSTATFTKGHNWFQYDADLVEPMRAFLLEHAKALLLRPAVAVDPAAVARFAAVPVDFGNGAPRPQRMHRSDGEGVAQEEKDAGSGSSGGGDICDALPSARCAVSPCTFCCEACVALALTATDTVRRAPPAFRYETKAARGLPHLTTAKILHSLATSRSLATFVVEEPPAHMKKTNT